MRLVNDFIEELQDQVHILDFNHLLGFLSASVTQRDSLHPNEHYMQYMIQLVSRWINAINATLGLANASDYPQPDLQTRMTECIDYARASLPPPVPTPTASPTDAPSPSPTETPTPIITPAPTLPQTDLASVLVSTDKVLHLLRELHQL